jgi:hypothetical protein
LITGGNKPGATSGRDGLRLTIGVTGHRDIVPGQERELRRQVRRFFEELRGDFPELELHLLTPLAEGADRMVTEVALAMEIPYTAVLPMGRENYEQDFADEASIETLREQISAAETVITLPAHTGIDPIYLETPGPLRDQQYVQTGVFISNHCQVLLALWDGRDALHIGGTADVLNYHLTGLMAGQAGRDESPNLLAGNENDLAYHIVCSRDRPGGHPADDQTPGRAHWVTAYFEREPGAKMPAAHREMLERLVQFRQDQAHFSAAIEQQSDSLLRDRPELEVPRSIRTVAHRFSAADWLAIHFQKRVQHSLLTTHVIAVLMGLSFILYSEYEGFDWLVLLFLALFTCGLWLHMLGERHHWHRKYLDYRALAEGLRVQFYWSLAGVVDTSSNVFAYDNFLQKQDVDLGWIRHMMRSISLLQDRDREPDPAWVDWVVRQWVGETGNGGGQVAYYHFKAAQKNSNFQRTEMLGNLSLWIGIFLAVVLVAASGRMDDSQHRILLVLMGVLPLIAAVRSAYSHKKADKELIKQYLFMGRVFANARKLLDAACGVEHKRNILRALGNAALEEHAEWILMQRERPLERSSL